ncbi:MULTISPECIES: hypothetical protein [Paraburkholderia]|uniref:hypothetical protein n=1 Tax=Paraburkholderia TaxID=1822464 RepID=UPI00225A3E50|nr:MULTISPECIES: hypothetical protein [Paraburkholderia]MCX4159329.1 hypothetical protein [Paraburkholderia aspalathi]MDN7168728.1 hypothetical protein [Paraburkholderia sp. SECH2]MDQ6397215.1 hypothetical protein [Paraburkholderia aspalathi]
MKRVLSEQRLLERMQDDREYTLRMLVELVVGQLAEVRTVLKKMTAAGQVTMRRITNRANLYKKTSISDPIAVTGCAGDNAAAARKREPMTGELRGYGVTLVNQQVLAMLARSSDR